MNWEDVLKVSVLDTQTDVAIKPEQQDENCLRKLKTFVKKVRRLRPTIDYSDFKIHGDNFGNGNYQLYKSVNHVKTSLLQNTNMQIKDEQTACKSNSTSKGV